MMTREELEMDYLKAQIEYLESKISIYWNHTNFGPKDPHVVKLRRELDKLNMLLIDLMVKDQELRIKRATIE